MKDALRDNPAETEYGATVIIRHRVLEGQRAAYEAWLDEIAPLCRLQAGHIDTQIIRPISGFTCGYTVILRFSAKQYAHAWMCSSARAELIRKVRPMLQAEDDFSVHSGLEFLFSPAEGSQSSAPTRWKQFVVTWSVIYPLVLLVPLAVEPLLSLLGLSGNRYLSALLSTGTIVLLMVYSVMPRYTKLVHNWLYR